MASSLHARDIGTPRRVLLEALLLALEYKLQSEL